jgi:hypothetical protein
MNNIGRNKTLWLKKQGCVFVDGLEEWNEPGDTFTSIWTEYGEYVGLADLGKKEHEVNFIYRQRLTNLMSINRAKGLPLSTGCNAVSVGFNKKEQAWYGWAHRGYGKFYVGYKIAKGSFCDHGKHKHPFTLKTLEEAKMCAIDMAEYLD